MNAFTEITNLMITDPLIKEFDVKVQLDFAEGRIWHTSGCPVVNYYELDDEDSEGESPRLLSIMEYSTEDFCGTCIQIAVSDVIPMLEDLLIAELKLAQLEKPEFSKNIHKRDDYSYLLESYRVKFDRHLEANKGLPSSLTERLQAVIDSRDSANAKILAAKQSAFTRSHLDEIIELELVPTKWRNKIKLDSEKVLIGISPMPNERNYNVTVVAQSYSIFSGNDTLVAYAPRYVYNYLNRMYGQPSCPQGVLVCEAPDPGSEELRYSAARLWDPLGDGPLVDLRTALDSAQAL